MRFLVDAQLPRRLAAHLREAGHEALHTLDLPLGNRTPDTTINELSTRDGYIVMTKDADFVTSFHLHRIPHKLLLISTGNVKNSALESLLVLNLGSIVANFEDFDFIEINQSAVIFHV